MVTQSSGPVFAASAGLVRRRPGGRRPARRYGGRGLPARGGGAAGGHPPDEQPRPRRRGDGAGRARASPPAVGGGDPLVAAITAAAAGVDAHYRDSSAALGPVHRRVDPRRRPGAHPLLGRSVPHRRGDCRAAGRQDARVRLHRDPSVPAGRPAHRGHACRDGLHADADHRWHGRHRARLRQCRRAPHRGRPGHPRRPRRQQGRHARRGARCEPLRRALLRDGRPSRPARADDR